MWGVALGLLLPMTALAQSDSDGKTATTDTLSAEAATGLGAAVAKAANKTGSDQDGAQVTTTEAGPFLVSFVNTPKVGVKANVRQNTYYGELISALNMAASSSFTNTAKWSYDEYRKQNKTVEKRSDNFSYNLGMALPMIVRLDGQRSWSHDKTTNTAGFDNLLAQDNKSLRLAATKSKARTGAFTHSYRFGGSLDDRKSENQGTANNLREATADAGLQTGWNIRPGLVLAGRIYGTATGGEKTLGLKDSPSSAQGDTVGVGVYYQQRLGDGRIAVSRANFRKKYLDFRKNSSGLIDTVGVAEDQKIVGELETKDALRAELVNNFHLRQFSFTSSLSRTSDDLDYATSGLGLKTRQQDQMALGSGVRVGVDSLSVGYDFLWKWDDQRLQGATSNRGRQYTKSRDLNFGWQRPLFKATDLNVVYHTGLSQDIAQRQHNQNDKDRLQSDLTVQLNRNWPGTLRVKMVYVYRQVQDLSIRENRSSNNNVKDTYEINPSYTWTVAPWLTWDQNYRVNIQYTDYIYSELESVSREDNYNKRGNLTTKVTLHPTKRLDLILRHDYNKKFNATRIGGDAAGNVFYGRDLNQTISKLDLGLTFRVIKGVVLEAATYRTRDDRVTFGRSTVETTDYSGEIWVGTRIDRTWDSGITLSGMVKKYNAFGPSVTETSANYWESDIWLKWVF